MGGGGVGGGEHVLVSFSCSLEALQKKGFQNCALCCNIYYATYHYKVIRCQAKTVKCSSFTSHTCS